ncbi:MAG: S8 family serine peptidase [Thermoanaerobaculia bacterium]
MQQPFIWKFTVRIAIVLAVAFVGEIEGFAAGTSVLDSVKAVIRPARGGEMARLADADLFEMRASRVKDYGSFTVVEVLRPDAASAAERARGRGLDLEVREEWNRVIMPRYTVDTRRPSLPGVDVFSEAESRTGLFVVQFVAPETPEWHDAVSALGLKYIQYVPHNAAIVAGDRSAFDLLRSEPFIEWGAPYHPAFRGAAFDNSGEDDQLYVVQVVNVDDAQPLIGQIESGSATVPRRIEYGPYVNLDVTLPASRVQQLHRERWVMTIERRGAWVDSGEREAIAVSGATEVLTYPSVPTATSATRVPWMTQWTTTPDPSAIRRRPRKSTSISTANDYTAWLSANGVSSTAQASRYIAVADNGLDNGKNFSVHPDLCPGDTGAGCPSRIIWQYVSDPGSGSDHRLHGTLVTGMAVARPSVTGSASAALEGAPGDDLSQRFYMSTGTAPYAKLIVQKIFDNAGRIISPQVRSMQEWMSMAKNVPGTAVQSQSRNVLDATLTPGTYSTLDQEYDAAVRQVNLPVTVSSGNHYSNQQFDPKGTTQVASPALAKNVITVGGTESYHPNNVTCGSDIDPQWQVAESLSNVAFLSRRGTSAGDGRVKPEVVAPATLITTTRRQSSLSSIFCSFGTSADTLYAVSSGTSFASPQVAASILLMNAKQNTQSPFSAAMAKAAVIGTATSMRGGIDKLTGTPIGRIGDFVTGQGFGRLDLSKLLGNGWARTFRDEASWSPFTAAGETRTQSLTIPNTATPTVIVLAWTDLEPPATSPAPALVRDLNLRIVAMNGGSCSGYVGNNFGADDRTACGVATFDSKNNVEVIVLPPYSGFTQFVVEVSATTLPGQPWTPSGHSAGSQQPFAVFALNAQ